MSTRSRRSRSGCRCCRASPRSTCSARRSTPSGSTSTRASSRPGRLASTTWPNSITNANSNLPTGTIYGQKTFVVQTNGQLTKASGYAPSIIAYRNGNPVRLEEVARVYDGVENDRSGAWQQGERCVMISIRKQPGTNVVEVVDRIKALLPTIREQLPAAMSLDTRSDRSHHHSRLGARRQADAGHHDRAGRAGDLPVPAQHLRDADPQPRAARLAGRAPSWSCTCSGTAWTICR